MAHLSRTKNFWYKPLLLLLSTYWSFPVCKICGSRVMRMCHFWIQNGPFASNKLFFWKIINIILIYLSAPFIVQNLKKFFHGSRVLRMHNFWAQNGQFLQIRIFSENLLVSFFFFHSCLSACQKSKSDFNLLVKY